MAIRIVDAVLGYEKKFKKLQAEMLLEEQENKEESVAEAAPESKSTFSAYNFYFALYRQLFLHRIL